MVSERRKKFNVLVDATLGIHPGEHYWLKGGVWRVTNCHVAAAPILLRNTVLRSVRRSVWGAGPNP